MTPQASGDIGQRMYEAFRKAFGNGAKQVLLMGTDIPNVKKEYFQKAFDALNHHDLILGPSTDGGYWLIGMNQLNDVFQGISWSTHKVFEQTLTISSRLRLKPYQLNQLTDIDTISDLERIMPEEVSPKPYVSVVIPTLNEEKNIQRTIKSATDKNAEVIVVDGGSNDHTVDISKECGAVVITSKKGRAVQQNQGVKESNGNVLLFLHADTTLPDEFAGHIFNLLMDPKTILGAFRFKTDINRPLMNFFERVANFRSTYLKLPYGDQAFFLRKSHLTAVGGFPLVPIAEDLMLVRRIRKLGKIKTAPVPAVTSGRRWQTLGMFRTFIINQIILTGIVFGYSPDKLAPLYKIK